MVALTLPAFDETPSKILIHSSFTKLTTLHRIWLVLVAGVSLDPLFLETMPLADT